MLRATSRPFSCPAASPESSSTSTQRHTSAARSAIPVAAGEMRPCAKAASATLAQVRTSIAQSPLCSGSPANGPLSAR